MLSTTPRKASFLFIRSGFLDFINVSADQTYTKQHFEGIFNIYQFLKRIPVYSYSIQELQFNEEAGSIVQDAEKEIKVWIKGTYKECGHNGEENEFFYECNFVISIKEQQCGIFGLELILFNMRVT